jgi:hypothetical protein
MNNWSGHTQPIHDVKLVMGTRTQKLAGKPYISQEYAVPATQNRNN